MSQHQAHGTTLASTLSTGLVGSISFYAYGGTKAVDVPSAILMSATAMAVAPRFGRWAQTVSQKKLLIILSCLQASSIPLFAIKYSRGDNPPTPTEGQGQGQGQSMATKSGLHVIALTAIGLVTGAASGIFGVGGGLAMVPLFSLFSSNHQLAIGTSLFAMIGPTIVSTRTHWALGNIDRRMALALFVGSGVGAYIGSKAVIAMDTQQQLIVFCTLMVFLVTRNLKVIRSIQK